MVCLNKVSESHDHSHDDFYTVLVTSVLVNVSIVITTIPFIKPIMDGLQTGILASDLRSMGGSALLRSTSYPLGPINKRKTASNSNHTDHLGRHPGVVHSASATSNMKDTEWGSKARLTSSEDMIIRQSTTVAVHFAGRESAWNAIFVGVLWTVIG